MWVMHWEVQVQDPPARPQGLEELLQMLAAQQVTSRQEGEAEPNEQQQAANAAYTQRRWPSECAARAWLPMLMSRLCAQT